MEVERKTPVSRRVDRKKRQKKINKRLFFGAVFILAALVLMVPVKNMIVRQQIRYGTLEWGTLEETVDAQGLVIRTEQVVTAPVQGRFSPAVEEWQKVPADYLLGYLWTEKATETKDKIKIAIKAPQPGLVVYHLDGLEGVLSPDLLERLNTDKLTALLNQTGEAQTVTQTDGGKPVLKIVDNLMDPFIYLRLPAKALSPVPKQGDSLNVRINGGVIRFSRVTDLKMNTAELQLVLELKDASDPELTARRVDIKIVPKSFDGQIVDSKSLVMKDNQPGLLIPDEGVARWVKVQVAGAIGGRLAVSGIQTGAVYIINPGWVREGQRIE